MLKGLDLKTQEPVGQGTFFYTGLVHISLCYQYIPNFQKKDDRPDHGFIPTMSYPESTVHEVQALRQELADTRRKLQDYADTGILSKYHITH